MLRALRVPCAWRVSCQEGGVSTSVQTTRWYVYMPLYVHVLYVHVVCIHAFVCACAFICINVRAHHTLVRRCNTSGWSGFICRNMLTYVRKF